MYKVVDKKELAKDTYQIDIRAPMIARKWQPGQFVILRIDASGERVPFTIYEVDEAKGTISLIFRVVGKTTTEMAYLGAEDSIRDVAGPLGQPSKMGLFGRCLCIGGGTGLAVLYPLAKALKAEGNEVTAIIGARTAADLILKTEFEGISNQLHIATDDGSIGFHGFVTQVLNNLLKSGQEFQIAYAIGPIPMMANVVQITKEHRIPTQVSLNPIIVDGTGMCGGCRVTVNGETKFACVDGPEFDGFGVDFEALDKRNRAYREQEKAVLNRYISNRKVEST